MKNCLCVALLACLLAVSVNVYAGEGLYVGGNVGLAMRSDSDSIFVPASASSEVEYDNGLAAGLAVGYGFGAYRVEGELSYQKNDLDTESFQFNGSERELNLSGDVTSSAFLVNGYYDFFSDCKCAFTPFITAGVGVAKVEVNSYKYVPGPPTSIPAVDDNDTVFAYQLGAGVAYAVSEKVTIDLKYRYFATADPKFDQNWTGGTTELDFASHNLLVGLRYDF